MWKLPDGKVINRPKQVMIGDVNYPQSIFFRWSPEELATLGIKEFKEQSYDQKWFKSTGFEDIETDNMIERIYTITEKYTNQEAKDLQLLVARDQYVGAVRRATEYMNFYDAVGDSDTKKIWSDYIDALKLAAKAIKDQVTAAGTYAQIIDLKFEWPVDPEEANNGIRII